MGCKCKEKYANIAKYSDDGEPFKKFNIIENILMFLGRIIMAILVAVLIIIIVPLFLVYMIVCYLFDKSPIINLDKLTRYISKHKEKQILTD